MTRARALTILPHLAIDFLHIGPTVAEVAVTNVGPGPALGIDVELVFEPLSNETSEHRRRYRQNVMVPGERHAFFPPGELDANINSLPDTYRAIRLVGSMSDAAGKKHVVDEEFADLREWRELLHSAGRVWSPPEPERRMGEAIGKALDAPSKKLSTELAAIRRAIAELRPGSEDEAA